LPIGPDRPVPSTSGLRWPRPGIQTYLYSATACWGISVGLLSATLPFRFQQLGLPIVEYGLALAAYAGGMLLTESVWGALAFRLGRPRPIVAVGIVVGGATLLLAFATTFPAFLGAEALIGALGVYLAPLLRWVALSSGGPGSAGSGTGRWSSVFGLGLAIGVSVGPVGFVIFGFRDVALLSIVALGVAVAVAAALPWSLASLPPATRGRPLAVRTLATRPFLVALLLVLIAFIAMTFTTNFLQYFSIVLFGGTPSEAGYVLGAGRLVTLAAAFGLGTVVDRWGPGRAIPAGFLLLLMGGVATWVSRSFDEMVAATLLFSAGLGWLSASLLPLAVDAMPLDHQGAAIGVFGSMEDMGLLVGPLLFGSVWAWYGPTSIFPVVTALGAAGLAASLVVAPRGASAPPATPEARDTSSAARDL